MKVFNGFYKREDKEFLNQMTDLKIASECIKRKIYKNHGNKKHPKWTMEEFEFLKNNWGKLSKQEIAEKLNRSFSSVYIKAARIGLKNYFVYSEEITLNALYKMIYKRCCDTEILHKLQSYSIPINKNIPCKNKAFRTIKIADFLEWFEQNKRVIDLSLTDEGCFGVDEPDWLKEKRNADKKAAAYGPHNRKWTPEENEKLINLVNSQKYGYRDISIILKRTEGALKRQMLKLKLEKRPLREGTHNMWKEKEIEIVRDLWLKGYQSCIIAEDLPGRSALSINGLLERYGYFGEPPRKNQIRGEVGKKKTVF